MLLIGAMIGAAVPALGADVAVIMTSRADDYCEALRGSKEVTRTRIVAEYNVGGDPDKGPAGAGRGTWRVSEGPPAGGVAGGRDWGPISRALATGEIVQVPDITAEGGTPFAQVHGAASGSGRSWRCR
jgi:hypothetical protein